jgi:hypothetical protein
VKRAVVLLAVLALAACGGTKRISPDHATLTDIDVRNSEVVFTFDVAPDTVKGSFTARSALAECGSGRPIRPPGRGFFVVHFRPAQSQGVPRRVVVPSGPVLEADKVCDFEADVGWAVALDTKLPAHVSSHGATVTVTFGG